MILQLIQHLPGYLTMNYVPGTGAGPVAFALFQDSAHAQRAINALQGQTICDAPVMAQVRAAPARSSHPRTRGARGPVR